MTESLPDEVEVFVFHAELTGDAMRARVGTRRSKTSVSHTHGCSIMVAADIAVGVDVELIRRHPYLSRLALRSMTPDEFATWDQAANPEFAFTQHWTRLEAYLKATGLGIRGGLLRRPPEGEPWSFRDIEVSDEHCAAIAVNALDVVPITYEIFADELEDDARQNTESGDDTSGGFHPRDDHDVRAVRNRTQKFAGSAVGATLGAGMLGLANALEGREKQETAIVVEQGGEPDGERVKLELDAENPKASKITFRR